MKLPRCLSYQLSKPEPLQQAAEGLPLWCHVTSPGTLPLASMKSSRPKIVAKNIAKTPNVDEIQTTQALAPFDKIGVDAFSLIMSKVGGVSQLVSLKRVCKGRKGWNQKITLLLQDYRVCGKAD